MFVFWFLLIPVAFLFYRMFDRDAGWSTCAHTAQNADPRENKALEILNERYAKGDISQEEYRTKKQDLVK